MGSPIIQNKANDSCYFLNERGYFQNSLIRISSKLDQYFFLEIQYPSLLKNDNKHIALKYFIFNGFPAIFPASSVAGYTPERHATHIVRTKI